MRSSEQLQGERVEGPALFSKRPLDLIKQQRYGIPEEAVEGLVGAGVAFLSGAGLDANRAGRVEESRRRPLRPVTTAAAEGRGAPEARKRRDEEDRKMDRCIASRWSREETSVGASAVGGWGVKVRVGRG
jgi:hypothetical protein